MKEWHHSKHFETTCIIAFLFTAPMIDFYWWKRSFYSREFMYYFELMHGVGWGMMDLSNSKRMTNTYTAFIPIVMTNKTFQDVLIPKGWLHNTVLKFAVSLTSTVHTWGFSGPECTWLLLLFMLKKAETCFFINLSKETIRIGLSSACRARNKLDINENQYPLVFIPINSKNINMNSGVHALTN